MSTQILPVWCELICDQCSRQLAGIWSSGLKIPREQLKDEAERDGAVIKGSVIFCKQCDSLPGAGDKGAA